MWECDLFDGGVCKPFPPPLVRGGVFLVGSDTKYRDIADGNTPIVSSIMSNRLVGSRVPRYSGYKSISARERFLYARQFAHVV